MLLRSSPAHEPIPMPAETDGTSRMREAECPFCERVVLVYQDPPRCPLCDCPIEEDRIRDHVWPEREPEGESGALDP
jgi:hypothetical protein